MSQKEIVRNWLEKNKTINSFQCYMELQIVDLQHAIMLLRKEGYNITDKWIKNPKTKKHYKEYRLEME